MTSHPFLGDYSHSIPIFHPLLRSLNAQWTTTPAVELNPRLLAQPQESKTLCGSFNLTSFSSMVDTTLAQFCKLLEPMLPHILINCRNDFWRFNLSSNYWTLMAGLDSSASAGIYTGANARPPSMNENGYWKANDNFLYLFGGWGEFTTGTGT
jgi:hypothetical protein